MARDRLTGDDINAFLAKAEQKEYTSQQFKNLKAEYLRRFDMGFPVFQFANGCNLCCLVIEYCLKRNLPYIGSRFSAGECA